MIEGCSKGTLFVSPSLLVTQSTQRVFRWMVHKVYTKTTAGNITSFLDSPPLVCMCVCVCVCVCVCARARVCLIYYNYYDDDNDYSWDGLASGWGWAEGGGPFISPFISRPSCAECRTEACACRPHARTLVCYLKPSDCCLDHSPSLRGPLDQFVSRAQCMHVSIFIPELPQGLGGKIIFHNLSMS